MLLLILLVLTGVSNFSDCAIVNSVNTKTTGMNGVTLKFVGYQIPPFLAATKEPDGNLTFVGTNILLVDWLSKKLNFTPSYVLVNETAIINYGSGNDLLVHLVVNREADVTLMGLAITPERFEMTDFTFYHWMEPYTMVVPRPGEDQKIFAFIRVFRPIVWLLILVSVLIVITSMTVFLIFYSKNGNFQKNARCSRKVNHTCIYNVFAIASYIVSTLASQGEKEPGRGITSMRVLLGVWLLMALVLVNSFSSTVISSLTVPRMIPPINSFEDLAANKDVGIILLTDLVIAKQILGAKTGVLKTLGDQARHNPDRLFTSITKVYPFLRTGHYAFPYLQTFCRYFVANQYQKEGKCRFLVTGPLPMYGTFSLLLQKNSKATSIFNKALMELWETGITAQWVIKAVPSAPKCFAKTKVNASTREPIRLRDVSGIFIVFGIGASFSAVVFFMEIIVTKCQDRKRSIS